MAFYKYKSVLLNNIFSKNDADAASTTMTGFKESTVSLIFDTANGTVSKQNNVEYSATPTNYFSNLSAFYIDYTYQAGQYTISVDTNCTEIRVLLCGAGGSGGVCSKWYNCSC